MIVTRSWLGEWIDLDGISTEDLAKTFNSIGLEVDRIEKYRVPKKIVFGRVIECEKHPDADKLNVCKVDIGTSIRQIVCGASNVRAGLDVVVATIGAEMPSGLVIKPVKLRGVESEGMICSSSEIGLETVNSGILELDSSIGDYELGQEVSENQFLNDDLIEIELTANRGDCLSIHGVVRDLSAAFDRDIKEQKTIINEDKRGVGRILNLTHEKELKTNLFYKVIELNDLTLPTIVKLRLAQIDDKRDSDIESLMLYTTHTTGVILRAYDYDTFCDEKNMAQINIVRDENNYISVMSTERASVVGVIQEDSSKFIKKDGMMLLEASYIAPDLISKNMYVNKIEKGPLFYNTSRGSEPQLSLGVLSCLSLIDNNSNSSIFSGSIHTETIYKNIIISLTKQEIDEIIGADIDKMTINKIFKNLGFNTSKSSADSFVIEVPQYRHDIVNKQDVVEEIVRLVGIDNIPSKPFTFQEENRFNDDYNAYKKKSIFRHRCAQSGFFESVHFVFDERKTLEKYGFETINSELELLNPIVQTLDTLRTTLHTGLLKAASNNLKNGYSQVKLFEVGSVFNSNREESLKMALLYSGNKEKESIMNNGKPDSIDFGGFVQKISDIIGKFELVENQTTHSLSHTYQSASIMVNNEKIGELFRVHPEVEKDYDLTATYMCELDFNKIPYGLKVAKTTSKYQASTRDLSIIMPKSMSYEKVKSTINSIASDELINFYPVDKYSDESLGDDVSLSIRFILQSKEKTLEEEDISSSMDSILEALKDELGIGIR